MKHFLLSFLVLGGMALFMTACDDDDDSRTLVDALNGNANYSTLVTALDRTGLDDVLNGSGPFTVFAPNNAAFTQLLTDLGVNSLDDIDNATLTNVLLNHVIDGRVTSSQVTTDYVDSKLGYNNSTSIFVSLFTNTASGVKVNDATVVDADISADNGVAHGIDKVMLPANIVNHALNNPNFSTLVAALTRGDLGVDYVTILSGTGPFTVFAPTNQAFADLLVELNLTSLDEIPADLLNEVLQYHVTTAGNVRAEDLTDEQQVTMFQMGTITIDLDNGAQIKDESGRTSNIIATNVQGTNGVVHAIDKVILPQ